MANYEIRVAAKENGVHHWQIANALGISEGTLCRRLRKELSDADTQQILEIISRLKGAQ